MGSDICTYLLAPRQPEKHLPWQPLAAEPPSARSYFGCSLHTFYCTHTHTHTHTHARAHRTRARALNTLLTNL